MTAVAVVSVALALAACVAAVLVRREARRRIAVAVRAEERSGDERSTALADLERLVQAMRVLPQGVVVWDGTGREVLRNDVAAAYAGARHGEALVEQAVNDELAAALAGSARSRSLDLFGPPRRTLVVSAAALDDGERITGAVAIIEDVSERRRLEAVRRDFVANISHELKTPVGVLGLLAETIAVEDDADVTRRLAERMTGEAFRVARIIDDLLDLSRIEGELVPTREPVSVRLIVNEAADRVGPLALARHIHVDMEHVPPRHAVRGDRRQLVSAVGNLLENACKYSDEGSTVEVRSRTHGAWMEIDVRDHGVGIPASDLERVFERFYRVDRARSRETGGTGLGLSIVRHVAGNHGGEVLVSSREGEGSVFTLRLPAASGGPARTADVTPAECRATVPEPSGRQGLTA